MRSSCTTRGWRRWVAPSAARARPPGGAPTWRSAVTRRGGSGTSSPAEASSLTSGNRIRSGWGCRRSRPASETSGAGSPLFAASSPHDGPAPKYREADHAGPSAPAIRPHHRSPTGFVLPPGVEVDHLDWLDLVGRSEPEDLAQERQLRLEGSDQGRSAPESVVLPGKGEVGVRNAALPQRIDDPLGLGWRDDPVFEALEDQDRAADPIGEVRR